MPKTFLDRMKHMMLTSKQTSEITTSTSEHIVLNTKQPLAPHILNATAEQGFLTGQLLVATPVITTGCFHKSVVYIFAHSAEGAMGVIINQPLDLVNFATLVEGLNLPENAVNKEIPVYYGGPVDRARGFVMHTSDYHKEHTIHAGGDISVTASAMILDDIMLGKGPRKSALIVGYSGWSAGQLEQEIEQNNWINVPASAELVFDTDNEFKWISSSKSLGIDMNFFSTTVGHA
jgi:putative transcriptional regulator